MNRTLLPFCAVLTLVPALWAAEVTFDESDDLASRFNQISKGPGGAFQQEGLGGTEGSGSVKTSSGDGTTAVFKGESFALKAGAPVDVSLYFYLDKEASLGSDKIVAQLGLVPDPKGDLRAASDYACVRVGVNAEGIYQFMVISRSDNIPSAVNQSSQLPLQTGHWYKLSAKFELAGSGLIEVSGTLQDYGETGNQEPSEVASFADVRVKNVTLGDHVYGAFRGSAEAGATHYDRFSIQQK